MKSEDITELPMVCGRCIQGNAAYFPKADYQGKQVYFCTEFCRNAFEREPERFYAAHRRPKAPSEDQ